MKRGKGTAYGGGKREERVDRRAAFGGERHKKR